MGNRIRATQIRYRIHETVSHPERGQLGSIGVGIFSHQEETLSAGGCIGDCFGSLVLGLRPCEAKVQTGI
eukprot:4218010-Pyramimonas_sp.AAC.1